MKLGTNEDIIIVWLEEAPTAMNDVLSVNLGMIHSVEVEESCLCSFLVKVGTRSR